MANIDEGQFEVTCPACYHTYDYDLDTHKPNDCPICGYSVYVIEPEVHHGEENT